MWAGGGPDGEKAQRDGKGIPSRGTSKGLNVWRQKSQGHVEKGEDEERQWLMRQRDRLGSDYGGPEMLR